MTTLRGRQVRLAPEIAGEYQGICGAYFNQKAPYGQIEILIESRVTLPVLARMDPEMVTFKGVSHCAPADLDRLLALATTAQLQQFPVLGHR